MRIWTFLIGQRTSGETSFDEIYRNLLEDAVLSERLPGYDPGDSDLEPRVLRTIVGAGLPPPVQQHRVRIRGKTFKLDLAYPGHLAGFDVDSWKYHGLRSPFTDDRTRRNFLELAGWKIYQFTESHTDAHIVDVVSSVLAQTLRGWWVCGRRR